MAAVDSGRPVIPFCLNYRTVGGKAIDVISRDTIFWYGDMDFIPHLWALAGNGGTLVDLHFLSAIPTALDSDSKAIAEQSQAMVEAVFRPVKKEEGPRVDGGPSLGGESGSRPS